MNPSKSRRALEHSMRNTCWKVERKRKNGEKGGKAKIDEEKKGEKRDQKKRKRRDFSISRSSDSCTSDSESEEEEVRVKERKIHNNNS